MPPRTHKDCGGVVKGEWQWWEDWLMWVYMDYCETHGGPIMPDEILRRDA